MEVQLRPSLLKDEDWIKLVGGRTLHDYLSK